MCTQGTGKTLEQNGSSHTALDAPEEKSLASTHSTQAIQVLEPPMAIAQVSNWLRQLATLSGATSQTTWCRPASLERPTGESWAQAQSIGSHRQGIDHRSTAFHWNGHTTWSACTCAHRAHWQNSGANWDFQHGFGSTNGGELGWHTPTSSN